MKKSLLLLAAASLFACGKNEPQKINQPAPKQEAAKESSDDKITRISLIAMADEAGQQYEGKHRTQMSAKEASDVAKKTAVFIKNSTDLINQGTTAQPDALASKAQTAFTILGMWPQASEMDAYNSCQSSLRNMARISALRQASHMATDQTRKTQLIAAADSLVESYHNSAGICLERVSKI